MTADVLRLLTRRHCHLCELVRGPLANLAAAVGVPLVELDIDDHPQLGQSYRDRIPVLLWQDRVVAEGRFDPQSALDAIDLPRSSR
ncbi:MAG: glutaredoxin family protein [Candidatus Dormibacteria bacterium]